MTSIISKLKRKYEYFNKPAGQDPLGKLIGSTYFIAPILFFLTFPVRKSEYYSISHIVNMNCYWILPITTMILTCASVTFVSAYLRKKDDTLNHYFGVASSSYILQKWQKNWNLTGLMAIALGYYVTMKTNRLYVVDKNQLTHEGTIIPHKQLRKYTFPSKNYKPVFKPMMKHPRNKALGYQNY